MSAAEKLITVPRFNLSVLSGPHAEQVFYVNQDNFTIGRSPENEVILFNDSKISRQHVRVRHFEDDVEIYNLSEKNELLIAGESVRKWKILNLNSFIIGDSEIQISFELPQIKRTRVELPKEVLKITPNPTVQKPIQPQTKTPILKPAAKNLTPKSLQKPQQFINKVPNQQQVLSAQQLWQQQYLSSSSANGGINISQKNNKQSILSHPKFRFYLIFSVIIVSLVYWLSSEPEARKKTLADIKPMMSYEGDFLIKKNSVEEKELDQKRKMKLEQMNSPTALRIEENFQKGMRDFYLGKYNRAIDFFQIVLNLDSNHELAKRHLYLSQIRIDEVLKLKLILGESAYQKHNFRMCQALYNQVLDMLEGKSNDLSYQKAQYMSEKCRLADEGIQ